MYLKLTVENLSVNQLANIAHANLVTLLASRAAANLLVVNLDAVDSLDTHGRLGRLDLCLLSGASWALLEVLGELDGLLVALLTLGISIFGLLSLSWSSLAVVLLELFQCLLRELWLLNISLGRLSDQVIKGGAGVEFFGTTLILALLLSLGRNELWDLIIRVDLSDAGIFKGIEIIALLIRQHLKLLIISRLVILILRLGVVDFVVVVVSIIIGNNIVTSEIDSVGSSNLEENTLVLTDSDIQWLLVVL